jgi:biotin operon repressor
VFQPAPIQDSGKDYSAKGIAMLYKGRQPRFENPQSNMRRVLRLMEMGYINRETIAEELKLTERQVQHAIWNLQTAGLIEPHRHEFRGYMKGRGPTVYKIAGAFTEEKSVFAGCCSIFNFGGKG